MAKRTSQRQASLAPRRVRIPRALPQHEIEILRVLARDENEIAEGKGHDLAAVMKEADKLLSKR